MRIWTAITGWAALMAASIALWAVGIAIEANPKTSAEGLFRFALFIAVAASLGLAVDLALLANGDLRRRRAQRIARPQFGKFDYTPEFSRAVAGYVAAQAQINEANTTAAPILERVMAQLSQGPDSDQALALANEVGRATADVCRAMDINLPVMIGKIAIMRQCLFGIAKVARLQTDSDVQELLELRQSTHVSRGQIAALDKTLTGLKRIVGRLRKQNVALSVNTSTQEIDAHLTRYHNLVAAFIWDSRRAEFTMWHRLFWRRVGSKWLVIGSLFGSD